ncbi:MAG TPA: cupin domain-containing protein [Dehalococcoidia bacterium]|nr:cupin domain-containing protein [Dehalococcoidia bacterium]
MSLPETAGPYALGPDDGEALWFNGALGILRATAVQTDGRFAAFELRPPKGFAAPLHSHENEDEFFLVLSGDVRLQHGNEIVEGTAGAFAYTPQGVGHSFHIDSDDARLLLFFGPAGVEGFFREVATPAREFSLPPADEPVRDRETLMDIMARHGQTVLGPPLPPKI